MVKEGKGLKTQIHKYRESISSFYKKNVKLGDLKVKGHFGNIKGHWSNSRSD